MIKKIIKKILLKLGYNISPVHADTMRQFSMFGALKRCTGRGIIVSSVIDIGASDGRWTRECLLYLPSAHYLLIEAQISHKVALQEFCENQSNVDYVLAAAGHEPGTIFFDAKDLFGGAASRTPISGGMEITMVSVDSEVEKRNLKPPYLLKLDTHGFEVPILEGARKTLASASLVIIEAYNYQLNPDSLKFYELCDYMDKLGFGVVEIADPLLRKYDHSFWQMDIFFVPKTRSEFSYNSYE